MGSEELRVQLGVPELDETSPERGSQHTKRTAAKIALVEEDLSNVILGYN